MSRLFLSPPHMGALERQLLMDAFDSNWVAPLGPHARRSKPRSRYAPASVRGRPFEWDRRVASCAARAGRGAG